MQDDQTLNVGVVHCDLRQASYPIAVGHYLGDVIVHAENTKIENTRDLARAVSAHTSDAPLALKLIRNGRGMDLKVKLGRAPSDR